MYVLIVTRSIEIVNAFDLIDYLCTFTAVPIIIQSFNLLADVTDGGFDTPIDAVLAEFMIVTHFVNLP